MTEPRITLADLAPPLRLPDPQPYQARPWFLIVNPREAEALREGLGELPPGILVSEPAPAREPLDRRVVACNFREATNVARKGARAYLVRPNPGGGDDRVVILVRSRGGRWVEKWEDIRRLENFRCKTLPPEHPLYWDERIWDHDAEAMACRLAAVLDEVPDGPPVVRT